LKGIKNFLRHSFKSASGAQTSLDLVNNGSFSHRVKGSEREADNPPSPTTKLKKAQITTQSSSWPSHSLGTRNNLPFYELFRDFVLSLAGSYKPNL